MTPEPHDLLLTCLPLCLQGGGRGESDQSEVSGVIKKMRALELGYTVAQLRMIMNEDSKTLRKLSLNDRPRELTQIIHSCAARLGVTPVGKAHLLCWQRCHTTF